MIFGELNHALSVGALFKVDLHLTFWVMMISIPPTDLDIGLFTSTFLQISLTADDQMSTQSRSQNLMALVVWTNVEFVLWSKYVVEGWMKLGHITYL